MRKYSHFVSYGTGIYIFFDIDWSDYCRLYPNTFLSSVSFGSPATTFKFLIKDIFFKPSNDK